MKVVLFCGGQGLRMREASERVPKPMIPLDGRPILWHMMKYFAYHGHTEFILCLGHMGDVIRNYFQNYDEASSDNFVLVNGESRVELLPPDIQDWEITFVDTGLRASIGQRLKAIRPFLDGEEIFFANYGDVLTDAPLPELVSRLHERGKIASFLCVKPNYSFHLVSMGDGDLVTEVKETTHSDLWINGGYMVFRKEIFNYIREGEDLVEEPFQRLIEEGQLLANRYEGFWAPIDTLKDLQTLETLLETGHGPWQVWELADKDSGGDGEGRAPLLTGDAEVVRAQLRT